MNSHASGGFPLGLTISISPFGGLADGEMVMAAPRRVIEVSFSEKELSDLASVSRSRTEPANHVQRACILLTYREKPSLYATGRAIGVTHQTVERCLRRARKFGVMAALDASPRPGREPTITSQARTFVVDLACRKPKDFGYPHEVWTTRLRPSTCASGLGLPDTPVWPVSPRELCARYWPRPKSNRTSCATTSNAAIPSLTRRWPRSFPSIARSNS